MALEKRLIDDEPSEEDWLIPVIGLSYEEGLAQLDVAARRRLNMSGEEFLRRWRGDEFSDEFKDEHHSALAVISLLAAPFGK